MCCLFVLRHPDRLPEKKANYKNPTDFREKPPLAHRVAVIPAEA
jgi:hypothetical protein